MRKPFIETFTKLAEKDDKLILIIGDVGFSFMEDFMKRLPNQFLNTGVCEQSMMGLAVGLSLAGYKPWVYSMINFVTMRPFEQVRNDIGFQNSNVKLLGVKGSAAYKFLGFSHNIQESIWRSENVTEDEDYHLMRIVPNMKIHIPQKESEVPGIVEAEHSRKGPAYIRL